MVNDYISFLVNVFSMFINSSLVFKVRGLFSSRRYPSHKVTIMWNSHISVVSKSPMIGILADVGKVGGNGILFPGGTGEHKGI
jgi:hypothetical protein